MRKTNIGAIAMKSVALLSLSSAVHSMGGYDPLRGYSGGPKEWADAAPPKPQKLKKRKNKKR